MLQREDRQPNLDTPDVAGERRGHISQPALRIAAAEHARPACLLTERAGLVDEKAVKVPGRTVIIYSPAIQMSAPS
jgi:hypothetical protein